MLVFVGVCCRLLFWMLCGLLGFCGKWGLVGVVRGRLLIVVS